MMKYKLNFHVCYPKINVNDYLLKITRKHDIHGELKYMHWVHRIYLEYTLDSGCFEIYLA